MKLVEKATLLKESPFFADLDLEMILPISDKLGVLTYKAGRPIFEEGTDATHVYLVADGEVTIGEKVIGRGALFGEEALLSGHPRTYTARSRENSLLLALSKANFFSALEECPSLAIALLEAYANLVEQRL